MTAKYDFKTSPDIQGDKEQATLYPQLVVSGTKDLTDLAKEIARRSTIKEGTVMGLFCDLENIIANYLADGYNVKLGELGTLVRHPDLSQGGGQTRDTRRIGTL